MSFLKFVLIFVNASDDFKGIGIGQVLSISFVTTYYVAIMGMIVRYLFDSFKSPLPWTVCDDAWNETCIASGTMPTPEPIFEISTGLPSVVNNNVLHNVTTIARESVMHHHTKTISSAELYFM